MKKSFKVCRVLAAAGNEEGIRAIKSALRGVAPPEELMISQAYTISAVRQKVSSYAGGEPVDLLIMKLPLQDETGIEKVLDLAIRNSRLQTILMVRRDNYEQTAYRCRNEQILVLSLPAQVQILSESVRYMLAIRRNMNACEDEVVRLRTKLSESSNISKAKCLLIERRGMTEEEAHYYLERRAMDRCVAKREIALEIIREAQME